MESAYKSLAAALSINALVMYVVTYALVADVGHAHVNLNRLYMTVMMVAPMGIVMLLVMRGMYGNEKLNRILLGAFALLFVATFGLARSQTLIGNEQFLHSMIPHHSSAILMCDEAAITDPDITRLCEQIVQSQREEIARMEQILDRR